MTLHRYSQARNLSRTLSHAVRVMAPALIALSFASIAHAQGTMDFSGAQTLMGTFKTFAAYIRRADEGTLSRLLVETSILLAVSRSNPATILRDAATLYKVDTNAITLKVKQEFAAKEKAKEISAIGYQGWEESGLANETRRGGVSPSLFFCAKIAQGEPVLVSPCTLIPLPAPARRPRGRSQVPPPAPSPDGYSWFML
jgi:hypothetical protein